MAARATDWVDLARMKGELRIPADNGDHDLLILSQIADAVNVVEKYTDLPLIDRKVYQLVPNSKPMLISPVRYLKAIQATLYREEQSSQLQRFHTQERAQLEIDIPSIDDHSIVEPLSNDRTRGYRLWGQGVQDVGVDWLIWLELTLGMDAEDPAHYEARAAVILVCRELWEGQNIAQKQPAWQRLLENLIVSGGLG